MIHWIFLIPMWAFGVGCGLGLALAWGAEAHRRASKTIQITDARLREFHGDPHAHG